MEKVHINFYSKENCSLCDEGLALLEIISNDVPLNINVIDIYQDEQLLEKYQVMIPVVEIAGREVDYGILSEEKIRKTLLSMMT